MRKFIERLLRSSGKLRRVARGKRRSRRPQVCPPPPPASSGPAPPVAPRARHSFLSSASAASRLSTTEASGRFVHAHTVKRRATVNTTHYLSSASVRDLTWIQRNILHLVSCCAKPVDVLILSWIVKRNWTSNTCKCHLCRVCSGVVSAGECRWSDRAKKLWALWYCAKRVLSAGRGRKSYRIYIQLLGVGGRLSSRLWSLSSRHRGIIK